MYNLYCFALVKIMVSTSFLGKKEKYRRETKDTYIISILFSLCKSPNNIFFLINLRCSKKAQMGNFFLLSMVTYFFFAVTVLTEKKYTIPPLAPYHWLKNKHHLNSAMLFNINKIPFYTGNNFTPASSTISKSVTKPSNKCKYNTDVNGSLLLVPSKYPNFYVCFHECLYGFRHLVL